MKNVNFNSDRIRLLITDECNYACPYCHNEGQFSNKNYISIQKVKELTDYIKINKIPIRSFTISGGEPTLHPNLVQIISIISKVTPNISMVTNGELLTSKKIDSLKKAGLKYIKFGIDSISMKNSKPQKSNFKTMPNKVISNLKYAKKILPLSSINTVVSKYNINKIKETIQFCNEELISVKFLELIEIHKTAKKLNPFEKNFSHEWFYHIYINIHDIIKNVRYNPILKKFYAETLNNVTIQFSEDFCNYGVCSDLWSRMDARGMLIPCIKSPIVIDPKGNLANGFKKVNSEMKKKEKWLCKNHIQDNFIKGNYLYIINNEKQINLKFMLTNQISCDF